MDTSTPETWDEALKTIPVGIVPPLTTAPPNPEIPIYEGPFTLRQGTSVVSLHGRIVFIWLPSPVVRFEGHADEGSPELKRGNAVAEAPEIGLEGTARLPDPFVFGSLLQYEGIFQQAIIGPQRDCDEVAFSLSNFHDIVGAPIRFGCGMISGRFFLRAPGWTVVIDQQPLGRSTRSGYVTTHACILRRTNGRPMDVTAINNQLAALQFWFAFCRGFWCGPILIRGSENGSARTLWAKWAPWLLTPRREVASWFPTNCPADVGSLYATFLKKWKRPFWERTLRDIVYWYVQANAQSGSSEASIVTSFVALEQLAWAYMVEDRKLRIADPFDALPASQRIAEFLEELSVPLAIPSEYAALHTFARRFRWKKRPKKKRKRQTRHGPFALAMVRNSIVHAKKNDGRVRKQSRGQLVFEARELSLSYIELSILAILGYEGRYVRRITEGTRAEATVQVPWA